MCADGSQSCRTGKLATARSGTAKKDELDISKIAFKYNNNLLFTIEVQTHRSIQLAD
eukprot:SAG31_NODE_37169_length_306_cov_1.246377_1_plen_56_part_10